MKRNINIKTLIELLLISSKLGFSSFGGPVAHLGYFHEEYVRRRKWMDDKTYADLVIALILLLLQEVIALGFSRK
ncbi:hypothetical protein KH172YL63_17270 [Bacillus sp. KH172YL63]|nr:hypothetical protein KH172YL63_17270 [Bacillus sp. KH172YL63]